MAELTVAEAETWQDPFSQQSLDTDDEAADSEVAMASLTRRGLQSLQHYPSIEEVDTSADAGTESHHSTFVHVFRYFELFPIGCIGLSTLQAACIV